MGLTERFAYTCAHIRFIISIALFSVCSEILLAELPVQAYSNPNLQAQQGNKKSEEYITGSPPSSSDMPNNRDWQPVAGTRHMFLVFSAYVESRTVAAVRVVAATKTRGADPVFCRLWLPDNRTITLKARIQTIRENRNSVYSATFVMCMLDESGVRPREAAGAGLAVLAEAARERPHTNYLIVLDTEPLSGIEGTIHICVKPFHSTYERFDWLIEWFELQILLGISHFYMYNSSLGNETLCMLNYYKRLGLVTILPWKLPFKTDRQIREGGQFAAMNDCLYRSMRTAGWLLPIDVDEVVMPRRGRHRTLQSMLRAFTSKYNATSKPPVAFLFRNVFFYLPWEDDGESPAPLITARKTRRCKHPHAFNVRSKYAVRPRDAVELGNHFLWARAPGAAPSIGVKPEIAVSHHYRTTCEVDGCLNFPSVVDRTAHRWSKELLQRVRAARKPLDEACSKYYLMQNEP